MAEGGLCIPLQTTFVPPRGKQQLGYCKVATTSDVANAVPQRAAETLRKEPAMTTHLANMFKLFSVAFAGPTAERTELITNGVLAADFKSTWEALELPQQPLDDFCALMKDYEGRDNQEALHEIRCDFTRLFMLDRQCENCESVFRKKSEGKIEVFYMVNDMAMAIQDYMQECGVIRPQGYNEPVDRIDNEWEFCWRLAEGTELLSEQGIDPIDRLDSFMDEHMKVWVPDFSEKLAQVAQCNYYRALALLQAAFIKEF